MFDSDLYRVKQKGMTLGRKYLVEEAERVILETRDKDPDLIEGLHFIDTDGEKVFELRKEQKLDVRAPFTVIDSEGNVIGGFQRKWGFLSREWQIFNSENCIVALLKQEKRLRSLLKRTLSDLFPFRFELISKKGETVGKISGRFSVLENYTVEVDSEKIDPRLVIALTVLIDVEEGF